MKKALIFISSLLVTMSLSACASSTCSVSDCEDDVHKGGYCKYHYTINEVKQDADDFAKDFFDSIFGN